MAQADINKLEEDLFNTLKKTPGMFRYIFSDKKPHAINVSVKDMEAQMWEEMARREGYTKIGDFKNAVPATEALGAILKGEAQAFVKIMYESIFASKKREDGKAKKEWDITIGGTKTKGFTTTIASVTGRKNVFKKFKTFKAQAQKNSIKKINEWSELHSGRDPEKRSIRRKGEEYGGVVSKSNDPFLDVGHKKGFEVGTQRMLKAGEFLAEFKGSSASKAAAKKALNALKGTNAFKFIVKNKYTKTGPEKTVEATLESSTINKASMSKGEVAGLNKILKEAINSIRNSKEWVHNKTSESHFDMVEKHIVSAFVKPLKSKNIKVTTKVKYKKKKNTNKPYKGKRRPTSVKKVRVPIYRKVGLKARKAISKGNTGAAAPLQLIGLINKELPQTVEGNMGRPRLEYVTGKLARSARITDIISTPTGLPSFGYTYDLNPYQTFEVGGNQGSHEYDPRRLIDQSIRSIAVKFAMGRFYTRRVQ